MGLHACHFVFGSFRTPCLWLWPILDTLSLTMATFDILTSVVELPQIRAPKGSGKEEGEPAAPP